MLDPGRWMAGQAAKVMGKGSERYHGVNRDFRLYVEERYGKKLTDGKLSQVFRNGFDASMKVESIIAEWAEWLGCTRWQIAQAHGWVESDIQINTPLTEDGEIIRDVLEQLTLTGRSADLRRLARIAETLRDTDND